MGASRTPRNVCPMPDCGRRFGSSLQLLGHAEHDHGLQAVLEALRWARDEIAYLSQ